MFPIPFAVELEIGAAFEAAVFSRFPIASLNRRNDLIDSRAALFGLLFSMLGEPDRKHSLIPSQIRSRLILRHPCLKEVLLLAEVHGFAHPGEGVFGAGVLLGQAYAFEAAVGYVFYVFGEEVAVEAEDSVG